MAKFGDKAPAPYRKNVIQQQMKRMTSAEKKEYINNLCERDKILFKRKKKA